MKKTISLAMLLLFGAGCASAPYAAPKLTSTPTAPTSTTSAPVKPTTTTVPKTKTAPKPSLQPSQGTVKPGPQTITVSISATGFAPQIVAVNEGDTVRWVNKDTGNHTVMSSASALWNSGNIPPGTSYSRKFPYVGSYTYVDGAHPSLGGTVVVH